MISPRAFRFFDFTVLVRDLDPQGHMANHVYVAYLSEARARYMVSVDPAGALRPSVVADVRLSYLSPLLPREEFQVGVRIARIGRSSITFDYEMRTADRLIARGSSVEVAVDAQTRRPREISAELRDRLAPRARSGSLELIERETPGAARRAR